MGHRPAPPDLRQDRALSTGPASRETAVRFYLRHVQSDGSTIAVDSLGRGMIRNDPRRFGSIPSGPASCGRPISPLIGRAQSAFGSPPAGSILVRGVEVGAFEAPLAPTIDFGGDHLLRSKTYLGSKRRAHQS